MGFSHSFSTRVRCDVSNWQDSIAFMISNVLQLGVLLHQARCLHCFSGCFSLWEPRYMERPPPNTWLVCCLLSQVETKAWKFANPISMIRDASHLSLGKQINGKKKKKKLVDGESSRGGHAWDYDTAAGHWACWLFGSPYQFCPILFIIGVQGFCGGH